MKNFFLFDWFAFLYRAYYAFPEMKNSDWQNMNAVYGFLRMLLKRLSKNPNYIEEHAPTPPELIEAFHELWERIK